MAEVGSYEAKTRLSELLERARRGERIVITRHGQPIAELRGVGSHSEERHAAVERMKAFQATHELGDVSLRELIDEGRRF